MEGLARLLNKLTIEDVEKLKVLMSCSSEDKKKGTANKEAVTLRVFAEEYKAFIQNNRSDSYLDSIVTSLNYLLEFYGSQKTINSISLKDAESLMIFLQRKVKKGYAVYYRNFKAAFNKAKDWGYVEENYFTKIKLPKRQKLAPIFINSNELDVIIKQISTNIVRDVITIGFYTGMRLSEIVNLKWKNVNFDNQIITVGDEEFTTKGRNQRFIPVCDEAMEILRKRKGRIGGGWLGVGCGKDRGQKFSIGVGQAEVGSQEREQKSEVRDQKSEVRDQISEIGSHPASLHYAGQGNQNEKSNVIVYDINKDSNKGYVFCKEDGKRFTGDYFSKGFKRACAAAGMDKSIHFHSLRHSFASNLAQKSVSLYTIKELLGHSSVSTTEIYSHLNLDSLREAVRVFDDNIPDKTNNTGKDEKNSGLRFIKGQ